MAALFLSTKVNMQHIEDFNTVLNFGKYKGKTFEEVCKENPGYIIWANENKAIELGKQVGIEAMVRWLKSCKPRAPRISSVPTEFDMMCSEVDLIDHYPGDA